MLNLCTEPGCDQYASGRYSPFCWPHLEQHDRAEQERLSKDESRD